MIPTAETPAGEAGTVTVGNLFPDERRPAVRTPAGLVCIRAFGRWYGCRPSRLTRSFRAA